MGFNRAAICMRSNFFVLSLAHQLFRIIFDKCSFQRISNIPTGILCPVTFSASSLLRPYLSVSRFLSEKGKNECDLLFRKGALFLFALLLLRMEEERDRTAWESAAFYHFNIGFKNLCSNKSDLSMLIIRGGFEPSFHTFAPRRLTYKLSRFMVALDKRR